MIYFILSTIIFATALPILYWLHTQGMLDVVTTPAPPPLNGPRISIIIPARNEQTNIQRCVEAALAQDYPNFEVLVLDDRSTDATPAILAELSKNDSRMVALFGKELPAGWAGKPHALHQAAQSATGEWLCFVDADTFLEPNALSAVLHGAKKTDADLYTLVTMQIVDTFWEKVVQPIVFTAIWAAFSPRWINDPKRHDAVAFGQFMLIKRSVYDALGGYEAIKSEIVEDKALAEQVKWNGYRLVVATGYDQAKTRMYNSFSALWEGWTKNIYLGLRDHPNKLFWSILGTFVALLMALFLPLWPLIGLVWYFNGGGVLALLAFIESLAVWGGIFYFRARAAQPMTISHWYALTVPLGTAIFTVIMLTSAWKVLSGKGVTWKGRTYDPRK
jgi:chlorobactene glucosyltransferase